MQRPWRWDGSLDAQPGLTVKQCVVREQSGSETEHRVFFYAFASTQAKLAELRKAMDKERAKRETLM